MPLNGTSRHSVGPSPRQSEDAPRSATKELTDARTERRVCGFDGDTGVAWRFVRRSSSGNDKLNELFLVGLRKHQILDLYEATWLIFDLR